jgi:hypothetical protein
VIYASSWWTLESAGWQIDDTDESPAFLPCDTEREAALVVSAFRKPSGEIAAEELWEMLGAGSPPDAPRVAVRCGDFEGYHARYEEDGLCWRVWWLACGALHIYASFNCAPEDDGLHDAVLDWMLSSLKAVPTDG